MDDSGDAAHRHGDDEVLLRNLLHAKEPCADLCAEPGYQSLGEEDDGYDDEVFEDLGVQLAAELREDWGRVSRMPPWPLERSVSACILRQGVNKVMLRLATNFCAPESNMPILATM